MTIADRVLAAIDMDGLLHFLDELVTIPSLGGSAAENEAQRLVAAQLRQLGLQVDEWDLDLPALAALPGYSAEFERTTGVGVLGRWGAGTGRKLILNGHVDVVPAGDRSDWRYPPWRATVAGANVYGRGALDMKGGLCCAIFAVKALRDAGVTLRGELLIQSVIGEEDGGLGTLAAVRRGPRADGAIVMEPTNLEVITAQAGALNFRLVVPGLAAHGATRLVGVSAIEKFYVLFQAIRQLEAERNAVVTDPLLAAYEMPYPICIGTIQAGDWASTVPARLQCEGRYGVRVGEDIPAARRELEAAIAAAAAADPWLCDHPPRLTWWGGQFAPARTDPADPLVMAVAAGHETAAGAAPVLAGVPYGADMRLLVNEGGMPTVLYGPGDVRRAHQVDESVPVAHLLTVTQTLALTILNFCR